MALASATFAPGQIFLSNAEPAKTALMLDEAVTFLPFVEA